MNLVLPDDERFAEFLHTALKDVHTPVPAAPKEEIWAAVMERRRGAHISAESPAIGVQPIGVQSPAMAGEVSSAGPFTSAGSFTGASPSARPATPTIPIPAVSVTARRRYSVPMRWAVPIAAAVLVIGVAAGWQFEHSRTNQPSAEMAAEATRIPRELPTQMAAEQHFAEVEQLITAVQNTSDANAEHNAAVEAEVAAWARDLLATTQLLLDSPLGMDPQRRKLLTDVEMVLVQIAQLAPNSIPGDREITERSIEKSQVKERLQHAAPTDGAKQTPSPAPASASEAPQGI